VAGLLAGESTPKLIMKLSTLYTSVPEYIEFGWVTAPNAAGQSISANTITTLNLTNDAAGEIADTGNLVGPPNNNQFTLPAGMYYCEIGCPFYSTTGANASGLILGLYNNTTPILRGNKTTAINASSSSSYYFSELQGVFTLSAGTALEIKALSVIATSVRSASGNSTHTNSTAGADQRTTIKLWKLK